MPTLKVTIDAELDGVRVAGFPLVRRLTVDEAQSFDVTRATGGGFVALPTGELGELQVLVLQVDQAVTLRLDAQADAGIVINPGGVIALVDVDVDDGAATNATLSNASGSNVQAKGLVGGT
jgi:hypothetical protein